MLQPRLPLSATAPPSARLLCRRCLFSTSTRHTSTSSTTVETSPPPLKTPAFTATTVGDRNDLDSKHLIPADLASQEAAVKLKRYRPVTPGRRHLIRPINDHLWKGRVYLPLTHARKGQHIGGRNNTGRVTVRHRGGGHKRRIRTVDFSRHAPGKHLVERIEHDPGRTAHIALLSQTITDTATGAPLSKNYSYIIAAQGMRAGDQVESYRAGLPATLIRDLGERPDAGMLASRTAFRGNCLPLHMVPPGTSVFNIGLRKNGPGQLCRGAGTFGVIVSRNEGDSKWAEYINVRLKSGEVRRLNRECCATVGVASNMNQQRGQLGKAGRKRWLGIRPTVRGVAMNRVDHPHGGGRGKSKSNRHPVSPWGQLTKGGFKTRTKSKVNHFLVTARPRSQGKTKKKAKKKKAE